MATVLEARAIITAEDKTGPAFKAIEARIAALSKMAANVGKAMHTVAASSAAVGRSAQSVAAGSAHGGNFSRISNLVASTGAMIPGVGALGAMGAAAAVGLAAKKVIQQGANLQHERARMEAAGMSAAEIADATYESAKLGTRVPNLDRVQLMHMLRNARTIVGSYEEAAEIIEPLAKMRAMVQAAHPGVDYTEDFDKLIKGAKSRA